jgi:hypothetical protein
LLRHQQLSQNTRDNSSTVRSTMSRAILLDTVYV